MAFSSARTVVWLPRRTHRSVTSANSRSTKFSQLPLVGVKWTVIARVTRQPRSHLADPVGAVVVHDQVDCKTAREIGFDVVEEAQELLMPMPAIAIADGDAACHVEGREQGRHSMTFVIMRLARRYAWRSGRIGCVRFSA